MGLFRQMKNFWLKVDNYVADTFYGSTRFKWGLFSPKIVKGDFPDDEEGIAERKFYNALLKVGYKKTIWQLVMPDQRAGLIKKVGSEGINEYHIRFYPGGIDAEIEYGRFSINHWKESHHSTELLEDILENQVDMGEEKESIRKQFEKVDYSRMCKRPNYQLNSELVQNFKYNKKAIKLMTGGQIAAFSFGLIDIIQSYYTKKSVLELAGLCDTGIQSGLIDTAIMSTAYTIHHIKNFYKYGTTNYSDIGKIRVCLYMNNIVNRMKGKEIKN